MPKMITHHYFAQNILLKPGSLHKKPGSFPKPISNPSLNPNPYSSSSSSSSCILSNPRSCSVQMALSIARPKHRTLTNPSLVHLFSSSSSKDDSVSQSPAEPQQQQQQQETSFSSYFSDVKASLKQRQQQNTQSQSQSNLPPLREPTNINPPISKPTSRIASLEEITKNLPEFRCRSSVPSPTESSPSSSFNATALPPSSSDHHHQQQQQQQISFQELYRRNMMGKSENSYGGIGGSKSSKPRPSFDAIKESLRQLRSNINNETNSGTGNRRNNVGDGMLFSGFRDSLGLSKQGESMMKSSSVFGGTDLPGLGKESGEEQGGERSAEFVKVYSHGQLGEKLRTLRPEVKDGEKEGWFSLEELNERLKKLREIEEKEAESFIKGLAYKDLRGCLHSLKKSDEEKAKNSYIQRLNFLGPSTTPQFMMYPPKEHLVEKYFHPDNMSSAEKLKIELSKVREEFKMSESDCGSARVQVAQLTTKIKHLSSVLHKKDKHSRKGLLEMVQKRKKLLKYLRRTDWDSYCFVLSKLGLRDNPEFKYSARN